MWVFDFYWKGAGQAQNLTWGLGGCARTVVLSLKMWLIRSSFEVFCEACSCHFFTGVWLLEEEHFVPGGPGLDTGSVCPSVGRPICVLRSLRTVREGSCQGVGTD